MLWLFFVADVILWMAGLGGHEESLTLAILLTIVLVIVGLIVMADHNYTPPRGHKTDWAAMHNDATEWREQAGYDDTSYIGILR